MAGNYLAADYALRNHNFNDASLLFIESLRKDPRNRQLLENSYLMLLLSGKVADALELARHYAPKSPPPIAGNMLLVLEAFRKTDYAKAKNLLNLGNNDKTASGKTAVDSIITPFLLSWCDVAQRNYTEALNRLRTLPSNTGNESFIAYQMALINDIAGLETEAEKYFSIALKDDENSYRFIKAAGNFYERTKKKDKAAILYANYRNDNPSSSIFKKDLERIKKREHIVPPRIISNASQGISQILLEVASGFYKENLFIEAQIYLQMVLYLEPASSQAHFLLANYYENSEDFDNAILHYQEIDTNSDFYWQSQINIALDYFKLGDLVSAKKHLLSLSKLHPSDYEVLLILADILRSENRTQEAINIYTQIISNTAKLPPHYWYPFYMRAISYDQLHMKDKAEADLLHALALNPDQEEVLNYLGYSWISAGKNIEKARMMIQKALKRSPDNPQFIDSLGWAYYVEGNYPKAIIYLENALELLPTDPTINDHLGDAYQKAGRDLEASFQWKRALNFSSDEADKKKIQDKLENL